MTKKLRVSVGGTRVPDRVVELVQARIESGQPFMTGDLVTLALAELRACGGPVSAGESAVSSMLTRGKLRGEIVRIGDAPKRRAIYLWADPSARRAAAA